MASGLCEGLRRDLQAALKGTGMKLFWDHSYLMVEGKHGYFYTIRDEEAALPRDELIMRLIEMNGEREREFAEYEARRYTWEERLFREAGYPREIHNWTRRAHDIGSGAKPNVGGRYTSYSWLCTVCFSEFVSRRAAEYCCYVSKLVDAQPEVE